MESTREPPAFSSKLVCRLLQEVPEGKKSQKKPNQVTLEVAGEALKVFVVEALQRAAHEARRRDDKTVTTKHVNAILGQLLLDF